MANITKTLDAVLSQNSWAKAFENQKFATNKMALAIIMSSAKFFLMASFYGLLHETKQRDQVVIIQLDAR